MKLYLEVDVLTGKTRFIPPPGWKERTENWGDRIFTATIKDPNESDPEMGDNSRFRQTYKSTCRTCDIQLNMAFSLVEEPTYKHKKE